MSAPMAHFVGGPVDSFFHLLHRWGERPGAPAVLVVQLHLDDDMRNCVWMADAPDRPAPTAVARQYRYVGEPRTGPVVRYRYEREIPILASAS